MNKPLAPANQPTLDQLPLFVSVAAEGSFSAAGRRLNRAQSAVSYGIANLEEMLGVQLFERSGRAPKLTAQGESLLVDARQVLAGVGMLQGRAAAMNGAAETVMRFVVDTVFPVDCLVDLCRAFCERFPGAELRVHSEVLGAVDSLVLEGTCHLGVTGSRDEEAADLTRSFLTKITMVPVVAAVHPMARLPAPISAAAAQEFVQIAMSERTTRRETADHAILSPRTWRVADAPTKLAMIRGSLGWGRLPVSLVGDDLASGHLVQLEMAAWGPGPMQHPLQVVHRRDSPPGPMGQWVVEFLQRSCLACPGQGKLGCCS